MKVPDQEPWSESIMVSLFQMRLGRLTSAQLVPLHHPLGRLKSYFYPSVLMICKADLAWWAERTWRRWNRDLRFTCIVCSVVISCKQQHANASNVDSNAKLLTNIVLVKNYRMANMARQKILFPLQHTSSNSISASLEQPPPSDII